MSTASDGNRVPVITVLAWSTVNWLRKQTTRRSGSVLLKAGTTPRAADNHRETSTVSRTSTRLRTDFEHLRRAPDSNRIPLVKRDATVVNRAQYACLLRPSIEAF
jgi:hypothetical protein